MHVLAALVAAVIGVSPSAEPPVAEEVRGCRSRAEGTRPQRLPVPAGVRIGPLVIWPSVRLRTSRTDDAEWPFGAKAPVVLPARTKVVFAIAPEARSRAAFQGRGGAYVSSVRFEACREREPAFAYRGTVGKFTGFPFAILVRRRSACVPMEVRVDGRATPFRRLVPVGRPSC